MAIELHENHGKVTLETIRRFYRRNSRITLYKLVQKTHLADMTWIFRPILLEKLKIDPAISTGPFVTTFIDIIGVSSYFLIAGSLLPV